MEKKQLILRCNTRESANLLINYYANIVENSGYSLVFLHGWRSEAKVWLDALNGLNYSTFALDLPGFGESQISSKAFTLDDFSEIVEEFILKLNLNNVVLIGHSNGGAIAIKTISRNKIPVQKLILVDSAGLRKQTFEKDSKKFIAKLVKPLFQLPFMQPLRKKIYISMGSEDYIAEPNLKETYLNIIGEDLSNELKNINIPTLLIWGDKDKATPLSDGQFMQNSIKSSELKIISGAEHFSFLENKTLFLDYLNEFLKV